MTILYILLAVLIFTTSLIIHLLIKLNQKMENINPILDSLLIKVSALTVKDDAIIQLLRNQAQLLKDALASGVTQETIDKVQAIADTIDTETQKITDEINANTPAE